MDNFWPSYKGSFKEATSTTSSVSVKQPRFASCLSRAGCGCWKVSEARRGAVAPHWRVPWERQPKWPQLSPLLWQPARDHSVWARGVCFPAALCAFLQKSGFKQRNHEGKSYFFSLRCLVSWYLARFLGIVTYCS